jgi:hypothetical protein
MDDGVRVNVGLAADIVRSKAGRDRQPALHNSHTHCSD